MHIFINDFIGGYLDRGMPLYVRNIIDGLEEEGFHVSLVRAPCFLRKVPRSLFYAISVLFEQVIVPVIGTLRRADLTLYPYNSIAIIDLLSGRGRIVLHDLEQLNRAMWPSKAYFLFCYRAIKWLNSPVFTISELTRQRLIDSKLFGSGPITILPNTFYAFEKLIRSEPQNREARSSLLLCTGSTANKDLETVVADYLPKVLASGFRVAVLGLHKSSDAPRLASLAGFLNSGQLRVCGQLSDREVAAEYRNHEIVWVHSLREGFGRCVVEGRLAGNRVICTNIPEFAELRDGNVQLYKNPTEFLAGLNRLLATDTPIGPYNGYPYRDLLRSAVKGGL